MTNKNKRNHKYTFGGFSQSFNNSSFGLNMGNYALIIDSTSNVLADLIKKDGIDSNLIRTNISSSILNTTPTKKETLDSISIPNNYLTDISKEQLYNFGNVGADGLYHANSKINTFAGGGPMAIGSAVQGAANVALTAIETSKANQLLRNQSLLNNNNARSLGILNTTINTNTDDGLLNATKNMQYASGIGADLLMRSKGLNVITTALGTNKATLQGAAAGMQTAGPWGALVGGVIGTAAGLFGGIRGARKGRDKARAEATKSIALANRANRHNDVMLANAVMANNLRREMDAMAHLTAEGGALDYDLMNQMNINKRLNIMNKQYDNPFLNGLFNKFAFGGKVNTNGGLFSNGFTEFNNGGTHELNPNEGIPQGIASDGLPNLVEEGEVKWDDLDYIFSNRLKPQKKIREKYHLSEDATYADAAKKIAKEIEERPNDTISRNGLNALYSELANDLEELKAKREQAKLKRTLSQMSLEELQMLMQQMAQAEQLPSEEEIAQLQMQEQLMQDPAMQELMMLEQAMQDPTMMLTLGLEAAMQMAEGGDLNHKYSLGSALRFKLKKALMENRDLDIDAFLKPYNKSKEDIDTNELEYLMNDKILAGNFDSYLGVLSGYDKSNPPHTVPISRGMDIDAKALEGNRDYQDFTNWIINAVRNKDNEDYYDAMQYLLAVDAKAKAIQGANYVSVFDDNGSLNIERFKHYKNDSKYGPWHTYRNSGGDWNIIIPPIEKDNPKGYDLKTTEIQNILDNVKINRHSELPRLAPLIGTGLNYAEILNKQAHTANPAGVAYIGPLTVSDYAAYKPQDVLRLWNMQRGSLQGIANDVKQGNSPSKDAMRIAAMNQQLNSLGLLIGNALDANYLNYLKATAHNASINQGNAANIMHADEYNANAYDLLLLNISKAQLLNNEYLDDIFNSRLAARNAFYSNLGKLGEQNTALNFRNALYASGYWGKQTPNSAYALNLIDLRDRDRLLKLMEELQKSNDIINSSNKYLNTPITVNGLTIKLAEALYDKANNQELKTAKSIKNNNLDLDYLYDIFGNPFGMYAYYNSIKSLGGKVDIKKYIGNKRK